MQDKELQVKGLFDQMLIDTEEYAKTYEHYASDMKNYSARVQWKFGSVKAYQIFEETDYSFKNDAEIEDPDILVVCDDLDIVKRFLKDELSDLRDLIEVGFEIISPDSETKTDTIQLATLGTMARLVEKIPSFRPIVGKTEGVEDSSTVMIPVNQEVGTFQNQVLSIAVVEYFINKSEHIFLYDTCPCRVNRECRNHDHNAYGCMLLGKGVLKRKPDLEGYIATKEEALERLRGAVADGLIPGFGRLRADAIGRIGGPDPDTGDLFNLCYCCPCCCVIGTFKDSPRYVREIFKRMEGLSVAHEEDACTECGDCAEVCIFGALERVDGKVERDFEKCFGCGRCVTACPNEAMSIALEEGSVEKMIARIESRVDVT